MPSRNSRPSCTAGGPPSKSVGRAKYTRPVLDAAQYPKCKSDVYLLFAPSLKGQPHCAHVHAWISNREKKAIRAQCRLITGNAAYGQLYQMCETSKRLQHFDIFLDRLASPSYPHLLNRHYVKPTQQSKCELARGQMYYGSLEEAKETVREGDEWFNTKGVDEVVPGVPERDSRPNDRCWHVFDRWSLIRAEQTSSGVVAAYTRVARDADLLVCNRAVEQWHILKRGDPPLHKHARALAYAVAALERIAATTMDLGERSACTTRAKFWRTCLAALDPAALNNKHISGALEAPQQTRFSEYMFHPVHVRSMMESNSGPALSQKEEGLYHVLLQRLQSVLVHWFRRKYDAGFEELRSIVEDDGAFSAWARGAPALAEAANILTITAPDQCLFLKVVALLLEYELPVVSVDIELPRMY
jgi:hypothetical protein